MTTYTVGLDVHSKSTAFEVQDETGRTVGHGEVPTTLEGLRSMKDRFDLPGATKVGLETGTVAFLVARYLSGLGLEPVVVDAHEVRLKAHRPNQKCDRRDAHEVCTGVRTGIYRTIVHVPPIGITELREALSRRRHFVRAQTAEVNATKRLLRASGLGSLARSLRMEAGWTKLERALAEEPLVRGYVEQHHALWTCAGEQVAKLDAQVRARAEPFAHNVQLLQTVPGVGPVVAMTVIATLSTVDRFASAKQVASYAGLVPSTYQSGARDAHGHITKRGSDELRAMLCEAAQHARQPSHPLNPFFAKMCAKGGYKPAVVAVAHRLSRILFAMLRDQAPFDVGKAGVEAGPFERTQVKLYRLTPVRPRQSAAHPA